MPPINSFIFDSKLDKSEMVISTYGDERNARNILALHVKNIENWTLRDE